MAHPRCLAGKCIPGAGREQDRKGAELDILAFREQRRFGNMAVDDLTSPRDTG